jgi:hypothetical protein
MNREKNVIEKMEERRLKWHGRVGRMGDHRWPKILQWHPPVDEKEVDPQKIGRNKLKMTCIEGV